MTARLLATAESLFSADEPPYRYYEPFLGGGALFFALTQRPLFAHRVEHIGTWATLSDASPDVVRFHRCVQVDPGGVADWLECLAAGHRAARSEAERDAFYYVIRDRFREMQKMVLDWLAPDPSRRAENFPISAGFGGTMLFLNHACFNGVWRVNRKGMFNIPAGKPRGKREHFTFPNRSHIHACSRALQDAYICQRDAAQLLGTVESGALAFLDPPYSGIVGDGATRKKNPVFQYGRTFGPPEQLWLAFAAQQAAQRGVAIILTNGNFPGNREAYMRAGLTVEDTVEARSVSQKGTRRSGASCLLAYGRRAPEKIPQ